MARQWFPTFAICINECSDALVRTCNTSGSREGAGVLCCNEGNQSTGCQADRVDEMMMRGRQLKSTTVYLKAGEGG